ncbi:hypothetical protein BaRGS_00025992 [Batillaria attramentaria]|uniref:Uncharacterized protein n=1 Tax=Batillaria attramentaria TaxID=370345 RepID=A0ABD0K658_9CAEN
MLCQRNFAQTSTRGQSDFYTQRTISSILHSLGDFLRRRVKHVYEKHVKTRETLGSQSGPMISRSETSPADFRLVSKHITKSPSLNFRSFFGQTSDFLPRRRRHMPQKPLRRGR